VHESSSDLSSYQGKKGTCSTYARPHVGMHSVSTALNAICCSSLLSLVQDSAFDTFPHTSFAFFVHMTRASAFSPVINFVPST
jgi:hypothetical protein